MRLLRAARRDVLCVAVCICGTDAMNKSLSSPEADAEKRTKTALLRPPEAQAA